ncbi:MAG: magnesium/cobalt transporter CorA [Bacteroidetes bacterium]|nr:magnesium/cobalt transporter CorA [Bacteroidota bacterium]
MLLLNHKKKSKIGKSPGTLIYTGKSVDTSTIISVVLYDKDNYEMIECKNREDLFALLETSSKYKWVNIKGLGDIDLIKDIGAKLKIPALILEDILNVTHRPKLDYFENGLFIIIKHISSDPELLSQFHQLNLLMTGDVIISLHESSDVDFSPIHERLINSESRFRTAGIDYLLYTLIDYIVDKYLMLDDEYNDAIDRFQIKLLDHPQKNDLQKIQFIKRNIHESRLAIAPVREMLNSIQRVNSNLISTENYVYFQDTIDHLNQIIDSLDIEREASLTLLDIYLSSLSNKMNEVMKVLTIIATIFIPLTFVAGVYGMNFENMPELNWEYGYPSIMALMFVIGVMFVIYFKRKKWF